MIIIFILLSTFANLYSFLEFRNGEKFDLVGDFGELKEDVLSLGIRLKALSTSVSIFSNNYKILYSKSKVREHDRSVLIIFDSDLRLNVEFFGDFVYKNEKIFLNDDSKIFDIVVVDQHKEQIINPLFVIKNRGNLNVNSYLSLKDILLRGKDDAVLELHRDLNLDVEFDNYGLVLSFLKKDNSTSRSLKGIYYFEVFLNNRSVFRSDFQSISLDDNSYVVSGGKNYNLNFLNIKRNDGNIEINNLKFTKGRNEIKIRYGDVYETENNLIYRFTLG
ncbi:hypothetical protein CR532_01585 [Candidatus Borreliella tachyglossi]|uniref:Uncharacterized protein n=2 Tax=Candidatus Borreliella tachyglossi TaxID=1964448 RepID=A0A2S1LY76_9SPIR|nr:hypothetical protein CR532_01585 [Candidatus Borreliella tachyglossi]